MLKPARLLINSVRTFVFILLVCCLAIEFVPISKAASPAHLCQYPTAGALVHQEIMPDGTTYYQTSVSNIEKLDNVYSAGLYSLTRREVIMTQGFFSTDYSYSDYENIIIDNSTVVDMWVSVVMKWSAGAETFNSSEGRQFRLSYDILPSTNTSTMGASYTPWTNDTPLHHTAWMSVNDVPGGVPNTGIIYEWHIFEYVKDDLTPYDLQRYSIVVAFENFDYGTSSSETIAFDYLGIYYAWVEDVTWQNTEFQPLLMGLIWLIIVFFPAMALKTAFGEMGFAGGIVLMTVMLGIADSGFLPITVMAFLAVSILFFKRG